MLTSETFAKTSKLFLSALTCNSQNLVAIQIFFSNFCVCRFPLFTNRFVILAVTPIILAFSSFCTSDASAESLYFAAVTAEYLQARGFQRHHATELWSKDAAASFNFPSGPPAYVTVDDLEEEYVARHPNLPASTPELAELLYLAAPPQPATTNTIEFFTNAEAGNSFIPLQLH